MIRGFFAALILLAAVDGARAEPVITSLVAAAFTAAGAGSIATATVFGIKIVGLIGSVLTAAIGLALAYAFRPKPPKPSQEGGAFVTQQAIPPAFGAYGECRLGGALMLREAYSGALMYVAALTRHKINQFKKLFLNDDYVTLTGSPPNVTGTFSGYPVQAEGRYGSGLVSIDTRIGENTETAYGTLTSLAPTVWTTAHRGDGISSICMVCSPVAAAEFLKYYPFGAPQPSVVAEWKLCFDPREVSHDPEDPDTFTFTKNTALHILDYLCFNPLGMQRSYTDSILPVIDRWIAAADACDEQVPKKSGGTEERYQSNGFFQGNTEHRTILESLLAVCDGWLCERGDKTIVLDVGVWTDPDLVLTDADISHYEFMHGSPSEDRINQSTARWTSPDHDYAPVETAPLIDAADQAARRGPARVVQYDFEYCHRIGQASRLHKIQFNKNAKEVRGTMTVWWTALDAAYSRRARIISNTIPFLNGRYIEISKPRISVKTLTVTFEFVEVDSDVYDYTAATDEQEVPPVTTSGTRATSPALTNYDVTATQINGDDGSTSLFLIAEWDTPTSGGLARTDLKYQVRWRLTDAGGGSPGEWTTLTFENTADSSGTTFVSITGVPTGTNIDTEARSISNAGVESEWTSTDTVSTDLSDSAPSSPTDLTATGGSGQVTLSCTSPNSANFYYVRFFRGAVSDPFGSASPIGSPIYGAPNSSLGMVDTVAAGSYDYWVVAYSTYDVASTEAGPETGTAS